MDFVASAIARSDCMRGSKVGHFCCWGIRVESVQKCTVPSEPFLHEHCGTCNRQTTVISCSEAFWDPLANMLLGDYVLQTCYAGETAR